MIICRLLVLLSLTVAVVLGSGSTAANATFADSAALSSTTVGTATVQPVTQLEARATCPTTTGTTVGTIQVKVEWWRSTSRGVTGYVVTRHLDTGASTVVARTDAAADEVFLALDASLLQYRPRFTVTTLTEHRWTATSAPSNVVTC